MYTIIGLSAGKLLQLPHINFETSKGDWKRQHMANTSWLQCSSRGHMLMAPNLAMSVLFQM